MNVDVVAVVVDVASVVGVDEVIGFGIVIEQQSQQHVDAVVVVGIVDID